MKLPSSPEAEAALLGALILSPDWDGVADLRAADFSIYANGLVYRTLRHLKEQGRNVDLVILRDELDRTGLLKKAGDVSYLAELVESVPDPWNLRDYAETVRSSARARRAALAAQEFAQEGAGNGALAKLETALSELRVPDRASPIAGRSFQGVLDLAVEAGATDLIPHGIPVLPAELRGGQMPGHTVIIGAFSGQGKTSLCIQQAAHHALSGLPTLYVTFELSEIEVGAKLCMTTQDPYQLFPSLRIWYPETDIFGVVKGVESWLASVADQGQPIVIIDYIQKIRGPEGESSRERQVAVVCEQLQSLGRRRGCIVIAAAQLNRHSQTEMPQLHHLRESGLIEQVADLALLVGKPQDGVMWLLTAKNRWGVSSTEPITCGFDWAHSAFLAEVPPEVRYRDLVERIVECVHLHGKNGKCDTRKITKNVKWTPFGQDQRGSLNLKELQNAEAASNGAFRIDSGYVILKGH